MALSTIIVTDSTCDIPDALIERYGILVIPQLIHWDGQVLRDRVDLQTDAFYRRLATRGEFPFTSQPEVQDLVKIYRKAIAQGARQIVVATVSSAISKTYQAACEAAEVVKEPVLVVDTKGLSMGLGWQVLAAARLGVTGGEAREMVEKMDQVRRSLSMIVYLDTFEYLRRGGRVGNVAWLAGALLDIKPLIYINHASGQVESYARVRTRTRAIEALYAGFFAGIDSRKPLRMAVLHGGAPEEARRLAERIQQEHSPAELFVQTTGPVLGIHTGPKALALCGYTED
jgi:DegV family protein with EDD domain